MSDASNGSGQNGGSVKVPWVIISAAEPVSDEEWQVERHLCIEIARHVMLEQERGTLTLP